MIEESEYFTDIMKKHFNKELVMNKRDNEDFEDFDMFMLRAMLK